MKYQEFVTEVQALLQEQLGDSFHVEQMETLKNNDTKRVGLSISEMHINISPTIYMEEFFARYQNGYSLEEIVEEVLRTYHGAKFETKWNVQTVKDFSLIQSKIVYKLINAQKNESLLQKLPNLRYLDFAIVFYVLFDVDETGTATIPITNDLLGLWDVDVEELHRIATENSPILLPSVFKNMQSVIEELQGCSFEEDLESPMFVLSNSLRSFGANCILYENELENLAERLGENYYILPSSVHEVVIVPQSKSPTCEDLKTMVVEINETQVDREEILSDNVYYYNRDTKELAIS